MTKVERNKGITLIALVITIIVLIILAGVSIRFISGENGILTKATMAKEMYEEEAAKEKLNLALTALQSDKYNNSNYNDDYINNYLINQNIILISNDIVSVDGWNFQIDRSVPKILANIGKGTENEDIQIEVSKTIREDGVLATLNCKITYKGKINKITINGEKIEQIPKPENNIYTIQKEITENKNCIIVVQDEKENYKTKTIEISELTEDMQINSAQELIKFQEKVNEGKTFEGKTVTLKSNIDLSEVCGENKANWIPIGNQDHYFKGKFDGNNHIISNIYINNPTTEYNGLFGHVENGNLSNITVTGKIEINNTGSDNAGLVGVINGSTVSNCINKIDITGNNEKSTKYGGLSGWARSNYF